MRGALVLCIAACAAPVVEQQRDWFDLSSDERSDRLFDALGTYPRLVRLESGEVRFVELGPTSDTPWLFVHGLAGTLGDFAPLIVSAGAKHHVLALDLPGFGGSVSSASDYSVAGFAKVIRELLEDLEVPRVHLVCHSLGGQVCIAFALEFPRFVASLTVIDAAGVYEQQEFLARLAKMGRINLGKLRLEQNSAAMALIGGDLEVLTRLIDGDPSLLATLSSFRDTYHKRVRELAVPTFIIWGEKDPLFPVEYGLFLKENIDGSVLRVVPGAGHSPQLSDPDLVLDWVGSFQQHLEGS